MINLIICRTHEKNKIKNHTTHQFFFGAFIKVVPAALLKAQISIWSIKTDWKWKFWQSIIEPCRQTRRREKVDPIHPKPPWVNISTIDILTEMSIDKRVDMKLLLSLKVAKCSIKPPIRSTKTATSSLNHVWYWPGCAVQHSLEEIQCNAIHLVSTVKTVGL